MASSRCASREGRAVMIEAPHYSAAGAKKKSVRLPAALFDGTVNEHVLHRAVVTFLANQRQGTSDTKTRSEVSGGNQKPWRQKGTGRARQGSRSEEHTSELQSQSNLVCRLLLEKKNERNTPASART